MSFIVLRQLTEKILAWLGLTQLLAAKMDLFVDEALVDDDTDPSLLTVASFPGYLQKTITWHVFSIADDGTPELVSNLITFRCTGGGTVQTCRGFIITDADGDQIAVGNIVPTEAFLETTDEASYVIRWRLGSAPILVAVS